MRRLTNCAFFIDNDLSDSEAICFECRCNLLKFVSVSFHKVKKMSVEMIQHDKEFLCSDQKAYEFKVCSCLFDVTYSATPVIKCIDNLWDMFRKNLGFKFGEDFYWSFHSGCYIACCKKIH